MEDLKTAACTIVVQTVGRNGAGIYFLELDVL
jgi:hypothetical protein